MPEPGIETETLTAEEQAAKAAEEKKASEEQAQEKKAAEEAAAAKREEAKNALPEKVAEINAQIAKQTEILNTLMERTDGKTPEETWTIPKLEEAELKCHAGEYDMKYLPKITTMKALLTARQVAKETTEAFAKENTWADVQAKWDKGHADAVEIFGDQAKDTESKLFKTAQAILFQDPGYKRFTELKQKGVKTSAIDPSLIDPTLQFKCFEIAAGRLGIARKDSAPNPNPGKGARNNALGAGTLPGNQEGQSLLDKLEKRASESGEQRDWIALDKERLRQKRESGR